ncbi:MAG TPA: hypothetical protein VM492_11290, partial [Sumerlaeia bacterium]|nr:hypothetical protein [Sumerlaeia bacterium]
MNPKDLNENLDAYLDGQLEGEALELFERVLAENPPFRAEVDAYRRLGRMMGEIELPRAPAGLKARIMAGVREEAAVGAPAPEPKAQGAGLRPASPFTALGQMIRRWQFQVAAVAAVCCAAVIVFKTMTPAPRGETRFFLTEEKAHEASREIALAESAEEPGRPPTEVRAVQAPLAEPAEKVPRAEKGQEALGGAKLALPARPAVAEKVTTVEATEDLPSPIDQLAEAAVAGTSEGAGLGEKVLAMEAGAVRDRETPPSTSVAAPAEARVGEGALARRKEQAPPGKTVVAAPEPRTLADRWARVGTAVQ